MDLIIEEYLIYGGALAICLLVVGIYLWTKKRSSDKVIRKIEKARQEGLYEPVSLHPVVDVNSCIQTGACIAACPEKDILGIVNGKATTINASHCVGHGACFHACPTEAITLCIGTEKRGVELPHVNQHFETSVSGIYIAGELGGMGLIKNAVEQGSQAVENIVKANKKHHKADFDLVIVGAGPAGISASLAAKKNNLKFTILDQDSLGGTVFTFPRAKLVMTSAMNLPLHGKVKLFETSKPELLELWQKVLAKNNISILENCKVESIVKEDDCFTVEGSNGEKFLTRFVLLAIGRRGTPRKLGIPGELSEKVAYRLLEPELINNKHVIVVGGGDSAIESALMLADNNHVILSYRGEAFSRLKPKNNQKISEAIANKTIDVRLNTNLLSIENEFIMIHDTKTNQTQKLNNDLVYIFAGGELPTQFLAKTGIQITKKFGEAILKH